MKVTLLIISLLSTQALAQLPQKGDWQVGGDIANLNIPVGEPNVIRDRSANVAVSGGRFISERIILGLSVPFEWQSLPIVLTTQRATTLAYGLVPFARFYLTNTSIRPYLSAGVGYLFTRYDGERETSHNGVTYNGNVGVAYFINRHVSLDAVGGLTSRPYQAYNSFVRRNDNRLNFYLRFQIFLESKQSK